MIKKSILALMLAVLAAGFGISTFAQRTPATAMPIAQVTAAADKFLAALDDAQRGKLLFDLTNDAQRKRWSNLPSPMFQRAGLRLGDLTQAQREAAMAVLSAALGQQGYQKVLQIVDADEALKTTGGGRGGARGGRGGGGPAFGRDNYYISFLGKPSATDPWTIQFGGHHLGLNITLAGDKGTLAPSHTGAQPAIYQLEGKTIRPLGHESDKAFALLTSLDEAQRKKAILGFEMRDLVLGPGREGQTIQPEGIKGADLTDKQRDMLLDLAGEWTGIMNDAVATAKMDEMKKNVGDTWFAWSGPTEKDAAAYFRVQGPTVFIEYAPQRLGGDPTKHIHTIYRDPTNEYGATWRKRS